MGRLTRKLDNGRYAQNYTTGDGFFVGMTEMMQKLGELEDLEEAGRLVKLPEGFDCERATDIILEQYCPSYFGVKDLKTCLEFSEEGRKKCKECWEAALKGAE